MLDLVGQGCGAAIPSLRAGACVVLRPKKFFHHPPAASGIIAANPNAVVAVCCVEICRCFPAHLISSALFCSLTKVSASWFLDNDLGVIIRLILFLVLQTLVTLTSAHPPPSFAFRAVL
jgi:hypothetical protein